MKVALTDLELECLRGNVGRNFYEIFLKILRARVEQNNNIGQIGADAFENGRRVGRWEESKSMLNYFEELPKQVKRKEKEDAESPPDR